MGTLTFGSRGERGGRGSTGIPARLRRMCTHCNDTPCRLATTDVRSPRHRSSRIASVRSEGKSAPVSARSVVMSTVHEYRIPPGLDVTSEQTVTRYQWPGDGPVPAFSYAVVRNGPFRRSRAILRPCRRRLALSPSRRLSVLHSFRFCVGIAGTFRGSGNVGAVSHWGR